ncbi:MAG: delta subunit of the central stalk of mitochondrial F1F0 ATP synthase, atp16 [Tremellales sp. Tagirdzhanova-0007]|nr:MAG: delta subunit of the central stalk of mitochondrial F1F0 ATP synthase, atp16 [Tremellales sp. Tagirdzhanova-0007]
MSARLITNLRKSSRPISPLIAARRAYADVADGKLQLSLVLPHQSLYSASGVIQVNLPAASGDMGVLANHVATVEALRPGVVEVIEEAGGQGKKWFVSAGFATMHGNNSLTINAVEAYELDKFSAERVVSSSAPESEKVEAGIEVEVFENLQAALGR